MTCVKRARGDEKESFRIPNHGDLTKWAEQGVLLLNTVLTVRAHEANSHSGKGWETFTDRAIEQLSQNTERRFLLWGKNAMSKERLIAEGHNHFVLKCAHPSPLSASRGFFGCAATFTNERVLVREVGRETIDWRL